MVSDPWFSSVQLFDGQFVLASECGERLLEVIDHQRFDFFWCLRGHKTAKFDVKHAILLVL